MNRDKRILIFERLREQNPTPTTELAYSSPFELLIAVIRAQPLGVFELFSRRASMVAGWVGIRNRWFS